MIASRGISAASQQALRPSLLLSAVRQASAAAAVSVKKAPARKVSLFTEEQIQQFRTKGYVVASSDLLTEQEKANAIDWATEMGKWQLEKWKWMQYFEKGEDGKPVLCRIENFLPYHEPFRHFVRGKITEAISQLIGEQAVLYKEKINFKLPGSKGFPPHQDAPAYISFGMKYHATCLLAADTATEENGCLQVVPRHPSEGMLPHPNGQLEEELVKKWEDEGAWLSVPCKAGDAVFFDSLIPHRSKDNQSKTLSRRIYYLTFNPLRDGDQRDGYYRLKRELFPPDNEKEPGKDYSEGAKVFNLGTPIRNKTNEDQLQ